MQSYRPDVCDDPLQELPDEPQLCPDPADAEPVTRVHEPSWGPLATLPIEQGEARIPTGYADELRRALAEVAGEKNARLRFVGYTGNERLDRRTALVYGDDIGLSTARARRAMERVRAERNGFVFQMHNLIPVLRAAENVEVPLIGLARAERRGRARRLLADVGLGHRADADVRGLSGGEPSRAGRPGERQDGILTWDNLSGEVRIPYSG